MENINKYKWILILVFAFLVIFVPVKIPNNISTYAKIIPSKQLVTTVGTNGQIITHLVNNFTGITEAVYTIQVDREDFASLKLQTTNSTISKGDTIATFSSSHTNFLIEELEGEILIQEKLLDAQITGKKESIIVEQEKVYEISKVRYLNQENIYERKSSMFKNNLISLEEFDEIKNSMVEYKLETEREFQKLITLKTGKKAETILATKEKIISLKKQKKILINRVSDYNIVAPFDGSVLGSNSLDTLFTISEINSYVAVIPVLFEKSISVKLEQSVIFLNLDSLQSIKLLKQEPQIRSINGKNHIIYKSQFKTDKKMLNNMYECSIIGEEKTIINIIKERFYSIF